MLDIFGSVFGRSRRSGQNSNPSKTVGLDDPSSSKTNVMDSFATNGNGNLMDSRFSSGLSTKATLERQLSHYSPLDGISFVINPIKSPNYFNSTNLEAEFEKIDQIGTFLQTPSLSEYNMFNEKTFLDQYR